MGSERVQLIRLAATGRVETFIELAGHRFLDVTVENICRKFVLGRCYICRKFVNVRTKRISENCSEGVNKG